jgi:peptidoglycan/LPS O-acetylase OafA/YrhL
MLAALRPATRPPEPGRAPLRHRRREEIQALRALAVVLVVLFHLWPGTVPGGFVGVDVFFVISGFLITGLLLREIERTGSLALTAFWARRARRLLPAALLVVLACAAATVAIVPVTAWAQFFSELRAGTAYVQNWHLASTAVDYFAAGDGPSPVRHFWSLSAEEQFYLVWPLLMVLGVVVARRRRVRATHRTVGTVLACVTLLSLACSLVLTVADPALAYFATPTRAWEFGAGGLLALRRPAGAGRPGARSLLSWLGLGAIVLAALAFTERTPFPGWAALLPVGGALAVLAAGLPVAWWAPTPLLRRAPVQLVGDLSYSIYLWHWPLLVLAPFVLGRAVGGGTTAWAILGLTLAAAWLTKVYVEDPVRAAPALVGRAPRWTLGTTAVATAAVLGVTLAGSAYVDGRVARDARATRAVLAQHPRCFGAASRDPQRPCDNPALEALVVPTPVEARDLANAPCRVIERDQRLRVCAFGTPPERAAESVAVVGDSHASHWRPALDAVAQARRWRGLSITRTGCAFSRATPDSTEPARSHCTQWNRQVVAWFGRHPEVHTVLVAAHAGGRVAGARGDAAFALKQRGYTATWDALPPTVRRILVLRDTPRMGRTTQACVQEAMDAGRRAESVCAVPRRFALVRDPAVAAAVGLGSPRVRTIDLTGQLCDRQACFPVIGGALAYKDVDHFTPVFATTLGPFLRRAVDGALG